LELILGKGDGDLYSIIFFEEGMTQQVTKNLPVVVLFALTFGPLLAVTRNHILGSIELDEAKITQTIK
jgi:hypothetical protein